MGTVHQKSISHPPDDNFKLLNLQVSKGRTSGSDHSRGHGLTPLTDVFIPPLVQVSKGTASALFPDADVLLFGEPQIVHNDFIYNGLITVEVESVASTLPRR